MKKLLSIIAVVIAIAYPLMVFVGLDRYGPRGLAAILLVFSIIRFAASQQKDYKKILSIVFIIIFCLTTMINDSELLLRFYPVLISLGVASIFFFSLWDEKPLIQKIVETTKGTQEHPPKALQYMRKLTISWAGFTTVNALIAAYTAIFSPLKYWALYNGLISYTLICTFVIAEALYRRRFRRIHGI